MIAVKVFKIILKTGRVSTVQGSRLAFTHRDYGPTTYIEDADGKHVFQCNSDDILSVTETSAERQSDTYEHIASYSRNVFIVHGHDEPSKYQLKSFLQSLRLNPFILHELDDGGLTVIEKYEHYATQCSFAFVLLTPDDKFPAKERAKVRWQSRQNVIMELGWFMARLGRERVALLYKEPVELPSDLSGVLYLQFERSIDEVTERMRARLRGVGLIED